MQIGFSRSEQRSLPRAEGSASGWSGFNYLPELEVGRGLSEVKVKCGSAALRDQDRDHSCTSSGTTFFLWIRSA